MCCGAACRLAVKALAGLSLRATCGPVWLPPAPVRPAGQSAVLSVCSYRVLGVGGGGVYTCVDTRI